MNRPGTYNINDIDEKTKRNYRNRIQRIILFWKEEFPTYYNDGVRKNTSKEMADPKLFFYNKYSEDIVYETLNVNLVLEFLGSAKYKVNQDGTTDGKTVGYDNLRKYRDALVFGASVRGARLPVSFQEVSSFLSSYRLESAEARKLGNVVETKSDPIPSQVLKYILKWCVEDGNLTAFFWTQCQWNCMERCVAMDKLAFGNFSIQDDAHAIALDENKYNKDNTLCLPKCVYTNPFDWLLCQWTGMALYCALNKDALARTDKLFSVDNNGRGVPSKKYQEMLRAIVFKNEQRKGTVKQFMQLHHFHANGLQQGAELHVVRKSPHQLSSLEIGQILSGKDQSDPSFATLPPHWRVSNPLMYVDEHGNKPIALAMEIAFGPIMKAYANNPSDPSNILCRCLACLVWHEEEITKAASKSFGRAFASIELLQKTDLLQQLKALVTTEPTEDFQVPSGIPSHVTSIVHLQHINKKIDSLFQLVQESQENLINVVRETINDLNGGKPRQSDDSLEDILQKHADKMAETVKEAMNSAQPQPKRRRGN